jgi:hypothetical protein
MEKRNFGISPIGKNNNLYISVEKKINKNAINK